MNKNQGGPKVRLKQKEGSIKNVRKNIVFAWPQIARDRFAKSEVLSYLCLSIKSFRFVEFYVSVKSLATSAVAMIISVLPVSVRSAMRRTSSFGAVLLASSM